MKYWSSLLLVFVLSIAPAIGQDEEEMPDSQRSGSTAGNLSKKEAHKASRKKTGKDAKGKIDISTLPRDANGQLAAGVWDIIKKLAEENPNSNEAGRLRTRPEYQAFYATYANWKAPEPPAPPPGKLRNLPDAPKEPRFPLTDKVWPSRPGDASVCLWEDDKLAAMSLGVDDNMAQDIPFWKSLEKKYGRLNITWNLIVCGIEGPVEKGRAGTYGTWKIWQELIDAGYHVASHSMCHNHDPVPSDGWPGQEWEASESQRLLNTHLKGFKVKLFCIPGAGVHEFKMLQGSWEAHLKKYYAAARGGGNPINAANQIDYFNIGATTANVSHIVDDKDPKNPDQKLSHLFAADPKHPYHQYYRGWANIFIHFVNQGKTFDTNPGTVAYAKALAFYNDHRADLWNGFIDDVALYGEERDTATLKTDAANDAKILFTLTSKMDPAVFDYPLTVKVRLPNAWKGAAAQQGGTAVPAQMIMHEGAPYALVKARPDRGQVTLTPAGGTAATRVKGGETPAMNKPNVIPPIPS